MLLRMANSKWIVRTPAKLNVHLAVKGRRNDGYHELQTLMVPIRLFDTLTFEPLAGANASSQVVQFSLAPLAVRRQSTRWAPKPTPSLGVPSDDRNLVVRALTELRRRTGCTSRAKVTLTKRIPAGTGLGGGSSDAAAALVTANLAWGLGLKKPDLMDIAACLGSDVPFFISCRPAICSSRGEVVAPLRQAARLHAVVASPEERLGSAEVYAAVREEDFTRENNDVRSRLDRLVEALAAGNVGLVRRLRRNALERPAFSLCPALSRLKATLERWSEGGAMMTGSGTSCFCLCRTARHAARGAAYLRSMGIQTALATASYG